MKNFTIIIVGVVLLFGCGDKKAPDVSGIKVNLTIERFEQDFFAADTNNLSASLREVAGKYPEFFPDFTTNILGLPPLTDTSMGLIRGRLLRV